MRVSVPTFVLSTEIGSVTISYRVNINLSCLGTFGPLNSNNASTNQVIGHQRYQQVSRSRGRAVSGLRSGLGREFLITVEYSIPPGVNLTPELHFFIAQRAHPDTITQVGPDFLVNG